MNTKNILGSVILCFVVFASSGCETEESRPPYEPLENIVLSVTKTMKWSEDEGLLNVHELESELNDEEKKIFAESLEWVGTESNFPLSLLLGKTAYEIVDIANCLKSNMGQPYEVCIEKQDD